MKMKKLFTAAAALMVFGILGAAEGDGDYAGGRGRREGREGRGGRQRVRGERPMGGMQRVSPLGRFKAEEEIRQKFPEEFAKVEKQLADAQKAMAELAKKAKVSMPVSMEENLRTLKNKNPEAFGKILAEENPRKAMMGLFELAKENNVDFGFGMRGNRTRRENGAESVQRDSARRKAPVNMKKLRKEFPEEMKKLDALRKENPAEFRKGLQELMKKAEQMKKETSEVRK